MGARRSSRRRASRRARRTKGKLMRRARKRGPHFTGPVRAQIHKVGAAFTTRAQQAQAAAAAEVRKQMCDAPSGTRRSCAKHIAAHLKQAQAKARRTTDALRNSKVRATKRSLAEIVAQMQQRRRRQYCAQKTIVAPMEQRPGEKPQMGAVAVAARTGPQPPLGPRDIGYLKLHHANRSLLNTNNRAGKIIRFKKNIIIDRQGRKLQRLGLEENSQGTSIISWPGSSQRALGSQSQSRSLDNSVQFLHERQLNQQRPSVQRLGLANCQQLQLMSTAPNLLPPARRRDEESGNANTAAKRLNVTRLVRPIVRSSSTQTTRISASGAAARSSPYNTRQRAASSSSSSGGNMVVPSGPASPQQLQVRSLQQQQQPAAATLAICERLGSMSLASGLPGGGGGGTSGETGEQRQLNEIDKIKASTYPRWWPWSKWDKSHECRVSEDQLGLCFHPESSESTAACRAVEPLPRSGQQYYWEIHVEDKCYGTSVMFGLCTRKQRMHVNDYCQLVGEDKQGWSLSHKGIACHNGQKVQYTDEFPQFQPLTVGVHYNTARGELSYFLNGKSLGVAFTGLNDATDEPLYPVVASTAKCTRMRLVSSRCSHMSLMDRSRYALIKSFARDRHALINYLRDEGAPRHLLEYVNKLTKVRDCEIECDQPPRRAPPPPPAAIDMGGPAARTRSSGHKPQQCSSGASRGNQPIRRLAQFKRVIPVTGQVKRRQQQQQQQQQHQKRDSRTQ